MYRDTKQIIDNKDQNCKEWTLSSLGLFRQVVIWRKRSRDVPITNSRFLSWLFVTFFFYRRDSPYDVVVMNVKNIGKTLADLPEGR